MAKALILYNCYISQANPVRASRSSWFPELVASWKQCKPFRRFSPVVLEAESRWWWSRPVNWLRYAHSRNIFLSLWLSRHRLESLSRKTSPIRICVSSISFNRSTNLGQALFWKTMILRLWPRLNLLPGNYQISDGSACRIRCSGRCWHQNCYTGARRKTGDNTGRPILLNKFWKLNALYISIFKKWWSNFCWNLSYVIIAWLEITALKSNVVSMNNQLVEWLHQRLLHAC